ncbi:MAG: DUF721 domain-containing protein [Frankiaceae bacterium]
MSDDTRSRADRAHTDEKGKLGGQRGPGGEPGGEPGVGARREAGTDRGSGPEGADGRTTGSGADLARAALARAREDAARRAAGQAAGSSWDEPSGTRRRGRPGWRGGEAARQEDPLLFAAALSQLLEERGWQDRVAVTTTLDGWDGLVGAEIAAHCRPVSLCDGILTVSADSTAWATQLRLLASPLLARLRRELGNTAVARIVVRGPVAPDWKHGALRVRDGRGPRDTYG